MEKAGRLYNEANKYVMAGEIGLLAIGAIAFPPLAAWATEALVLDGATTAVVDSYMHDNK